MGEVVNLRLARKAKKRADHRVTAAENRAKHGQTRVAKLEAQREATKLVTLFDGAKRED